MVPVTSSVVNTARLNNDPSVHPLMAFKGRVHVCFIPLISASLGASTSLLIDVPNNCLLQSFMYCMLIAHDRIYGTYVDGLVHATQAKRLIR